MNNIWYINPVWVAEGTLTDTSSFSIHDLYDMYNTFTKSLHANKVTFENKLIDGIGYIRKENKKTGVVKNAARVIAKLDVISLDTREKINGLEGNSIYWKQGDHKYLSYGFYHVALFSPSFEDFKTLVEISEMDIATDVSVENVIAKDDDLEYLEMA
jgi:hypothetical protein